MTDRHGEVKTKEGWEGVTRPPIWSSLSRRGKKRKTEYNGRGVQTAWEGVYD